MDSFIEHLDRDFFHIKNNHHLYGRILESSPRLDQVVVLQTEEEGLREEACCPAD